jgi:hypothetical protein
MVHGVGMHQPNIRCDLADIHSLADIHNHLLLQGDRLRLFTCLRLLLW